MKLNESQLILIFNLVQKEVYSKEVFQLIPRKQLKELYEVLKIEITNLYKFREGYHTANRARGSVIYRDKYGNPYKVELPKNDPGGEHD